MLKPLDFLVLNESLSMKLTKLAVLLFLSIATFVNAGITVVPPPKYSYREFSGYSTNQSMARAKAENRASSELRGRDYQVDSVRYTTYKASPKIIEYTCTVRYKIKNRD
jgi:hypothetical protein